MTPAPRLLLGVGNPSRGDDALGPLCLERIAALNLPGVECLGDFQLQIEHALDLAGRGEVVFVDASLNAAIPFTFRPLHTAPEASYSTHALTPAAVLHTCTQVGVIAPPAWQLAIRGEAFALGAPLSPAAHAHLDAAVRFLTARWGR